MAMHPKVIDLTGKRFGRLTVIGYAGRHKKKSFWRCRCECGFVDRYQAGNLQRGATTKCKHCRYKYFNRTHCKRRERKLTYKGRTRTISEWAEEIGLPAKTVYHRVLRGLPVERVISPGELKPLCPTVTYKGKTQSLRQWAEQLGISRQALVARLANENWTKEEALTLPNTWPSLSKCVSRLPPRHLDQKQP
jgi:hypothetical protein